MDLPFSVMLSEASPTAESPVDLGVELRPHQKAALRRCVDVETNGVSFDMVRELIPHWTARNVNTRIMGLCDSPGAGKSHVIIALCAGDTPVPAASVKVSLCSGMMSYDKLDRHETEIRTSVIVVPHGVLHQWKRYLDDCSGIDSFVLGRRTAKTLDALRAALRDSPPSILLCSDTGYPTVLNLFCTMRLRARRFVLDEADTIPIPKVKFVSANMNWMVTASVSSLLMNYGYRNICNRQAFEWWRELYNYASVVRTLMIVKSTDAFLRDSMRMDPPIYEDIPCVPPPGASVLRGLVPDSVQTALDTDDLELARTCIGTSGDTDDIVAVVRKKWTEVLDEKRDRLRRFEILMGPGDDAECKEYLRAIRKSIADRESWLATLEERVSRADTCGICYDKTTREDERAMMGCCSAVYCLSCAHRWVSQSKTCPTCRGPASFHDNVHVMVDSKTFRKTKKVKASELVSELCSTDAARILFCSSNRSVFDAITFPGGSAVLKGQGTQVQRTIEAFRAGTIRSLCMANDCYCTGVNLEFVTDVIIFNPMGSAEEQMIGRAQRPGRARPLRVWRFVYESDFEIGA